MKRDLMNGTSIGSIPAPPPRTVQMTATDAYYEARPGQQILDDIQSLMTAMANPAPYPVELRVNSDYWNSLTVEAIRSDRATHPFFSLPIRIDDSIDEPEILWSDGTVKKVAQ